MCREKRSTLIRVLGNLKSQEFDYIPWFGIKKWENLRNFFFFFWYGGLNSRPQSSVLLGRQFTTWVTSSFCIDCFWHRVSHLCLDCLGLPSASAHSWDDRSIWLHLWTVCPAGRELQFSESIFQVARIMCLGHLAQPRNIFNVLQM
jgi:hypothetical protein